VGYVNYRTQHYLVVLFAVTPTSSASGARLRTASAPRRTDQPLPSDRTAYCNNIDEDVVKILVYLAGTQPPPAGRSSSRFPPNVIQALGGTTWEAWLSCLQQFQASTQAEWFKISRLLQV
jgi:hypothetical protein